MDEMPTIRKKRLKVRNTDIAITVNKAAVPSAMRSQKSQITNRDPQSQQYFTHVPSQILMTPRYILRGRQRGS